MFDEALKKKSSGDFDGALKLFQQILTLKPTSPQSLNCHGLVHYHMGRYDSALSCISKALESDPLNPVLMSNLGLIYKSQSQYDTAIQMFTNSLEIRESFVSLSNRGLTNFMLGKYKESVVDLNRALLLKPSSATHSNLGLVHLTLGRYKQALDHFETSSQMKSSYIIQSYLAESFIGLNNYTKALEAINLAMETKNFSLYNSGRFFGLRSIIISAIDGKLNDKILGDLQIAKKVIQDESLWHYFQGRVYYNCTKFQDALSSFTLAVNLDASRENAHSVAWRGRTHFALGNIENAKKDLEEALKCREEHEEWTQWKSNIVSIKTTSVL
eukprot:TRINITY_DN3470_c0_g1_i1.p1 TRINITY_DN3470_c0_g1~~TRINITY_DN3470_c0_g1_i1.p1  ORF type:complete len:328 (+),score=21.58 TRINITY_DN3470_c0_g1_i1:475-1458(+)